MKKCFKIANNLRVSHALFMIFFVSLCSMSVKANNELQPEQKSGSNYDSDITIPQNFVKLETSGTYTFLATSTNLSGGETVDISKEYYICKYAVTNAEWKEYINASKASAPKYWTNDNIPEGRESHPVLWISDTEAENYCKWLSDKTEGWTFRLPTQAEWEYAAAGQNKTAYPWDEQAGATYSSGVLSSKFNYNAVIAAKVLENPDRMATYNNSKSTRYGEQDKISDIISVSSTGGVTGWVDHTNYLGFIYTDIFTEINDAGGNTCAVDSYPEGITWCGCYNMCGNCWEWTSTVDIAQNGAEKCLNVNVIRGGSWYANASSCKASFRGEGREANSAYNTVGFRLVAIKNTTTSINMLEMNPTTNEKIYNLQGIEVKNPRRGLYIINGKKKMIR